VHSGFLAAPEGKVCILTAKRVYGICFIEFYNKEFGVPICDTNLLDFQYMMEYTNVVFICLYTKIRENMETFAVVEAKGKSGTWNNRRGRKRGK